jgi:hypothetical protein
MVVVVRPIRAEISMVLTNFVLTKWAVEDGNTINAITITDPIDSKEIIEVIAVTIKRV